MVPWIESLRRIAPLLISEWVPDTEPIYCLMCIGAGERTRTADLLITNQLLYQLSYAGKIKRFSTYCVYESKSRKIILGTGAVQNSIESTDH